MSSIHEITVLLRELTTPLPDSVIGKIVLFNRHPIADIVRELENADYGKLENYIIDSLSLPKNILLYNRDVFRRITRDKSYSIFYNAQFLGLIMASEQISRVNCLTVFYNTRYFSRHPPVIVHSNPIVIHRTEPKTRRKRALSSELSSLLCCEAIKKDNDRCTNRKKDGTNYCGKHKNRI